MSMRRNGCGTLSFCDLVLLMSSHLPLFLLLWNIAIMPLWVQCSHSSGEDESTTVMGCDPDNGKGKKGVWAAPLRHPGPSM